MLTNSYSKSLAASSFRIMILSVRILLCSQDAGARSTHALSSGHCREYPDPGAIGDVLINSGAVLGGLEEPPVRPRRTGDQREVPSPPCG